MYQANYEAGLRILDLNEADGTLQELAYFDVHPTGTTANFNGAWSNYPWLSGSQYNTTVPSYFIARIIKNNMTVDVDVM